jgi:hypothetical protein
MDNTPPTQNLRKPRVPKRQTGKIARLPEELRLRINRMIYDGLPYAEILKNLVPVASHLKHQDLRRWRRGCSYLRWESERLRTFHLRDRAAFAIELTKENEGSVIQKAGLDVAASQFLEMLHDLDVSTLRGKLRDDPQEYARIVNTMVRLAEGSLKFERYKAEVAAKKELMLRQLNDSKRPGGMTPEVIEQMEQTLRLM